MFDILIKNGLVIDGSGKTGFRADVAITNGRIAEVGLLPSAEAATVIDATGLVVAPGFIDMHSHADFSLPVCPTADSLVHQGITTAVVGQCGYSPVPLLQETRVHLIQHMDASMGRSGERLPWERWASFKTYLEDLSRIGTSLNIIPLVGQGTVRAGVVGYGPGAATPEQLAKMTDVVACAMDEGAFGLSTGLIYPPGSFTQADEIAAIAKPVGDRGGIYFSHIRGEAETLLAAIAEAIQIGMESGAAVQISHFKVAGRKNWDTVDRALDLIDEARAQGLDVTTDLYPYLAGSTGLAALLPVWAHEGGKEAVSKRLADPDVRKKMTASMQFEGFAKDVEWDKVLVSFAPGKEGYQGRYVAELAQAQGKSPYDWIFDALLETGLRATMVTFMMSEENRLKELRHPAMMFGTDGMGYALSGSMSQGLPHPRNYGTFPRILGYYVREKKVLSVEQAVWKMTGFPAQKLGLRDRGLVKKGHWADLTLFDPKRVADKATYVSPHQYPEGIPHVLVRGMFVVRDGVHTGARPAGVLPRP
jgi:N-acyl-D-aspartate/D-glutamate deacylase